MSRSKNEKRSKGKSAYFVPITWEIIDSDAYAKLTNASRTAYLIIKRQYNVKNPTEFRCPYSTAERFMDRHTFSKSIKQLIEMGFIKKIQQGGLYRKINVYSCSDAWKLYHAPQYLSM